MVFREFIFPSWIRLTRANRNARRKASDRGQLLFTAAFICGAVGLDTDLSMVYQLFALLVCLMIAARLSLRFMVPEVSLKRRLPRYATAEEPFDYYITVYNDGERVERDLRIVDNPKVIPPTIEQYRAMKEPGEETRNAYDRWIGFHRFVWLQRLMTGINVNRAHVPDINLRSHVETKVEATPLRRGVVNFLSTTVLYPDPLAMNFGTLHFENPQQMIVLPKRYPISRKFNFFGGRHFQPGGVNSTWSIGESDEFVSLRDYRDGDPIRKIHWASTAKRDKPIVKEFQDEFFVRLGLVVDTHIADPMVFEEVISIGASLLTTLENNDGLVDLCYRDDKPRVITAGRGFSQTSAQLEALALLVSHDEPDEDFIQMLNEQAKLMSGCVLVFGEWDETKQAIIDVVTQKGITAEVFVVTTAPGTPLPAGVHQIPHDNVAEALSTL